MKTAKECLLEFYAIAKDQDFTEKVVGDYAFRNKNGDIIRLKSCKFGEVKYVIMRRDRK